MSFQNKTNKITFYNKIQVINHTIFFLIIFINIIFYTNVIIFDLYKYAFLFWNIAGFTIYAVVNFLYNRSLKKENQTINLLLNNHLNRNKKFINNIHDIYKFYKRLSLRKNILEKKHYDLKDNFNKFVPKKLLENIGKQHDDLINVGTSTEKFLHIMFIDIFGFTSISENLTPDKSLSLLNIYFDGIVEIVQKNGGHIDKFMGDGILIVFDSKESDIVLITALEINVLMSKLNSMKVRDKIILGIGMNSGVVTLGTIGSRSRMDISIIGDSVNIAARLEKQTRVEKEGIIFSKSTFDNIKNKKQFNIKNIGERAIKGKKQRIKIYGI